MLLFLSTMFATSVFSCSGRSLEFKHSAWIDSLQSPGMLSRKCSNNFNIPWYSYGMLEFFAFWMLNWASTLRTIWSSCLVDHVHYYKQEEISFLNLSRQGPFQEKSPCVIDFNLSADSRYECERKREKVLHRDKGKRRKKRRRNYKIFVSVSLNLITSTVNECAVKILS